MEMNESFEWVEIIEPSRKEHMFANLKTGQCLWVPPDGVAVKPTHENQWWELYDTNTRRYYYYNATSQITVWRQPKDGDIIPLAKLQLLKAKEEAQKTTSNSSSKNHQRVEKQKSTDSDKAEKRQPPPVAKKTSFKTSPRKVSEENEMSPQKYSSTIKHDDHVMEVVHDNDFNTNQTTSVQSSVYPDKLTDDNEDDDDDPIYENYDPNEQVYENFNPIISGDEHMSVDVQNVQDEEEDDEAVYENVSKLPSNEYTSLPSDTMTSLPSDGLVNNTILKSSTLPRTNVTKPICEKPKFNSFRSRAPQKPPRTSIIERNDSFHVSIETSPPSNTESSNNDGYSISIESSPRMSRKPIQQQQEQQEQQEMEVSDEKEHQLSPYQSHNTIPTAPPPPHLPRQLPQQPYNGRDSKYDNLTDHDDSTSSNLNGSVPTDDSITPSGTLLRNDPGTLGRGSYYERLTNEDDGHVQATRSTSVSPTSPRQLPQTPEPPGGRSTPVKRSPLTRVKSDSSDMEKKPKVSKTSELAQQFRPVSMMNLSSAPQTKPKRLASESNLPEHVPLTTHRKGIFRRRMSIHSMLSWSKTPIKKPLVMTRVKQIRKEAVEVFKLILQYMGDKSSRKNQDFLSVEITTKGWNNQNLRDEIYIQLCKQTTKNEKAQSLRRGWELITACLTIFPPSNKFHSYLEGYIYRNLESETIIPQVQVDVYAKYCYKQLERICQTGAKRGLKGPSVEEIHAAIKRVFNPSMFGNSLEDIMEMQTENYPDNRLPWILTTLTDSVLLHNGLQTEGIFRVPGDIDEVNSLRLQIDKWQPPQKINEPHVPASLLKLWFRDLYEPLIPQRFYDQCIHNCDNEEICLNIVNSLPPLNNLVFSYLIRLLQAFMIPENVSVSKMDENNLAMVWAPNCLRCPSDDPLEIFENTRKEMTFLRTVMKSQDTTFLEGVV